MQRKKEIVQTQGNMQANFHSFNAQADFHALFQSTTMFNSPPYSNKSCTENFSRSHLILSLNSDENLQFSFCRSILCLSCRTLPIEGSRFLQNCYSFLQNVDKQEGFEKWPRKTGSLLWRWYGACCSCKECGKLETTSVRVRLAIMKISVDGG